MQLTLINFAYLVASVLFILGLKGLTHPRTAVRGNLLGALGMLLAVVVTLLDQRVVTFEYILAGIVVGALIGSAFAARIPMTSMPELVAVFNGFGGIASVLVAGAALLEATDLGASSVRFTISTAASGIIGAVTFLGSVIAFLKLAEFVKKSWSGGAIKMLNVLLSLGCLSASAWLVIEPGSYEAYWLAVALAAMLGIFLVIVFQTYRLFAHLNLNKIH